jgi:hypothetical protein
MHCLQELSLAQTVAVTASCLSCKRRDAIVRTLMHSIADARFNTGGVWLVDSPEQAPHTDDGEHNVQGNLHSKHVTAMHKFRAIASVAVCALSFEEW